MDNKYYTPTIEEFHIGFEHERLECPMEVGENDSAYYTEWIKYTILEGIHIVTLEDNYYGQEKPMVRVKYLDKDDIEELGWGEPRLTDSAMYFDKESKYRTMNSHIVLNYDINHHWVLISVRIYASMPDDYKTLFAGTIKNKSELKILMKQLGV